MMNALRKHHISVRHAVDGIVWAFSTQPNFRVHLVLSAIALLLGYVFQISGIETLIILFTILLGLTVEMVNTALESLTDLVTKEWKQEAKVAKDVSAGMMLIVAIGALIVGCVIFVPHLLGLFS